MSTLCGAHLEGRVRPADVASRRRLGHPVSRGHRRGGRVSASGPPPLRRRRSVCHRDRSAAGLRALLPGVAGPRSPGARAVSPRSESSGGDRRLPTARAVLASGVDCACRRGAEHPPLHGDRRGLDPGRRARSRGWSGGVGARPSPARDLDRERQGVVRRRGGGGARSRVDAGGPYRHDRPRDGRPSPGPEPPARGGRAQADTLCLGHGQQGVSVASDHQVGRRGARGRCAGLPDTDRVAGGGRGGGRGLGAGQFVAIDPALDPSRRAGAVGWHLRAGPAWARAGLRRESPDHSSRAGESGPGRGGHAGRDRAPVAGLRGPLFVRPPGAR